MTETIGHNPGRHMVYQRQVLSLGARRIGLLIGAGAPVSVRVDSAGKLEDAGHSLIHEVARLAVKVKDQLEEANRQVIGALFPEPGANPNIE